MAYPDADAKQIDLVMESAWKAFAVYRRFSLEQRAGFIKRIAMEIEALGDQLIFTAMKETNLPEARLRGEKARTIFQLNSYAEACRLGSWLEVRIDTAVPGRTPPKPDLRKMLIPLGPVVVFGASNFPFAYSTAGGDTACAFAAGCPVIVKAHPAHAETSEQVAGAILKAAEATGMPAGIFAHVHGNSFETGKSLVIHPHTKAVGFTGSFSGGKALFDIGNQRKEPIPVFAEMGSINPIFLLSEILKTSAAETAKTVAASVTLSVGQFCTNPGLLIGIDSQELTAFTGLLKEEITRVAPAKMLHPGIAKAYADKRAKALAGSGVEVAAVAAVGPGQNEGAATIATVGGDRFLADPLLHEEVFGPYSLLVRCKDQAQMLQIAQTLEGQLTASIMGTLQEIERNSELVDLLQQRCGRFILNGVPTGVEVCLSMQHGGPYPATTDSRYTSVGADGIKRFARPIALQNWEDELLPDALKNSNPLGIWRTVNEQLTREGISS